jgi:hypothetical protein
MVSTPYNEEKNMRAFLYNTTRKKQKDKGGAYGTPFFFLPFLFPHPPPFPYKPSSLRPAIKASAFFESFLGIAM